MSDGSEKRPLTKMLWSVSIKTRTFASVNTCNGSFQSYLKLLKQHRTIEQMCSNAHIITLTICLFSENSTVSVSNTFLKVLQNDTQGKYCTDRQRILISISNLIVNHILNVSVYT